MQRETTVVNVKHHLFDVYIGRRMSKELHRTGETDGKFGRPALLPVDGPDELTRKQAWVQYIEYLFDRLCTDPAFYNAVRNLRGKRLGCWCKLADLNAPRQPHCHGDVLAWVAERLPRRPRV